MRRALCRIFGHSYILTNHPSLRRSHIPLMCRRCGTIASQRSLA